MPIRAEFRKFYGKEWREVTRPRILARAGNRCEECGKPNNRRVKTSTTFALLETWMFWAIPRRDSTSELWSDHHGRFVRGGPFGKAVTPAHEIRVVLTIAHLDRIPGHDDPSNLRALCQFCHLHFDRPANVQHARITRTSRKDAARPLLNQHLAGGQSGVGSP